jgi:hypothetical protein
MRIKFSLSIDITREPKPEEPHETFESQGSLVEMTPQPRYVGWEATENGQ